MRLALMPAVGGWRSAAVPQQAVRFREPLWIRPWASPGVATLPVLPAQEPDVQVVGLQRASEEATGEVVLTLQNLGPARRRLRPGSNWQVVARLDGLHKDLGIASEEPVLDPWSLTFWKLRFLGSLQSS